MNFFEKLSMILIPIIGLTGILYFFSWYVQEVDKGELYESQRLQGKQSTPIVSFKPLKVVSHDVNKPKVVRRATPNNNFIKWESDESITYMPQSVKNRAYKKTQQVPSYTYPSNDNNTASQLQQMYKLQVQAEKRRLKKQQQKNKKQQCSYYLEQKEEIRDRMRRKYTASQYNHLEKKHKHWSKIYADNCFSGYQYPR